MIVEAIFLDGAEYVGILKALKICDVEDETAAGVVNVTACGGDDICFSEVTIKAAGNSLPLFIGIPPTAAPLETNVRNEVSFKFGGSDLSGPMNDIS
jgi:hypothetical protein